jgi:hypothetical protein
VVSRMLSLLGAHLGPEEDLMEPRADNPTGFWESRSITALHDDLLAELGGRWDRPAFAEDGWEARPALEPFRERIRGLIASHFQGAEVAYWKDPRGSLLLPLWRTVTPVAGTILVLRDPVEVAASLALRNGLVPDRAVWLWLRYVSAAVRADPEHLLVSHADLYSRPHWVLARVAAFCDLPAPTDEIISQVSAFVDPKLRHFADSMPVGPTLRAAQALFRILVREQRDVAVPFADLLYDRSRALAELEFFRDRATALLNDLVPPIHD